MNELKHVTITPTSVFFGDVDLCEIGVITEDGVTVTPGGEDGINQITITFFVGDIDVDKSLL